MTLTAIPTNIITGFLGVGKTTAITHLLKQKPEKERWAVLVNEFGEIGIDGGLLGGSQSEDKGVFIREVPGGCMCCAAGLPMQVALNQLLSRAKPHRLLIEPTGLGHPREVLAVLTAEHYRSVLNLRATIAIVDARMVQDRRYTNNDTFNQQLAIADLIVANKADRYQPHDFPALEAFLTDQGALGDRPLHQVSHGQLQPEWLSGPALQEVGHTHNHESEEPTGPWATEPLPECGYLGVSNQGEGFHSRGWIFTPDWVFDARKLYSLLLGINAERIKGVFITDEGVTAYNKTTEVLTETQLDDTLDSRAELIDSNPAVFETLEQAFLDCVTSPDDQRCEVSSQ